MSQDNLSQWQRFAEQARAGELYLDDEVAAHQVVAACNRRISELQDLARLAQNAQNVSGFGDFNMADVLAGKFLKQATGTENSIDSIIAKDIEVVKDMRDIMAISIARLRGQDYTNSAAITAIIDSVGEPQ
ncbi:hypothetical protein [Nocardia bhagyanarayanae]|uniref:Uncharacterized protein n=1 Tax=Nocardia bhagyanarayanae TaxID=1215925 RepID=A0A543EXA9_9NOCA|nr:hypothetical protein [Nocardia bhagyanarayanae]TQM26220.1 hypothetical protein FB390_6403 [Nocardia bhagyanarayanae]